MSARVWTHITLAAACLACGAGSLAQTAQVRPAPVSGHIGGTQAVLTSTAVQVPPPANAHEPLLPPESANGVVVQQDHQPKEAAATAHSKRIDRTEGVAKPRKSATPQKLANKTSGKARHHAVGKPGGTHEGNKDGAGKKKGSSSLLAAKRGLKPGAKVASGAVAKASVKTGQRRAVAKGRVTAGNNAGKATPATAQQAAHVGKKPKARATTTAAKSQATSLHATHAKVGHNAPTRPTTSAARKKPGHPATHPRA